MIRFEKFEKYYGKVYAVGPLDLEIPMGETFALLGPNGSGKSTLISALVGLHAPSKGKILIHDLDISRNWKSLRNKICYLPQKVSMPDMMTAREILTLFAGLKKVSNKKIDPVLNLVSLQNDADRYVGEFSGGMLQRLGLAVAFLSEPEILVLDEPTLNLDPLGRETFRELILQLKQQNVTIILSSHIMQDAELLADRIGVLNEGKLSMTMTAPEFKESISLETTIRIILHESNEIVQQAVECAGATMLNREGAGVAFKAPPNRRLEIIRAIEEAGGIIREFHSEPPDWEVLLGKKLKSLKD